jgi:hypothetical protein
MESIPKISRAPIKKEAKPEKSFHSTKPDHPKSFVLAFKKAISYSARHKLINQAQRNGNMLVGIEYVGFIAYLTINGETYEWDIRKSNPKPKPKETPNPKHKLFNPETE